MQDQAKVSTSGIGVLARLYWMFLGNMFLLFLLAFIFQKHPKLPSLLDALYFVVVASLICVRYIDIRFLNGETGEGNPATMADWRQYAMIVAPVGVGVWLSSRVLIHFLQ